MSRAETERTEIPEPMAAGAGGAGGMVISMLACSRKDEYRNRPSVGWCRPAALPATNRPVDSPARRSLLWILHYRQAEGGRDRGGAEHVTKPCTAFTVCQRPASVLETRPKRAACEHRAGSITHSSAQMGLSNAWVTHPAANYCAQDDSSPHQLEATRVFGRISSW